MWDGVNRRQKSPAVVGAGLVSFELATSDRAGGCI
jgi:hypothetical protein